MSGALEPVNTLSYLTKEKSFSPQLTFKWRDNFDKSVPEF